MQMKPTSGLKSVNIAHMGLFASLEALGYSEVSQDIPVPDLNS